MMFRSLVFILFV